MVILQEFLQKIVKDSVLYAENGRRKRVTGEDVDAALKNNGIKVYGLEGACSQSESIKCRIHVLKFQHFCQKPSFKGLLLNVVLISNL